ncbi:MAG: PorT family protein [Bacteroidales bacterium]|nr:PorT family protein [Bacteroidales bacterium]
MNTSMKPIALILFIVSFTNLQQVQSQNTTNQTRELKPVFGFRMAPNVGWIRGDEASYENDGATVGFSWGFIAEFPAAENYSFATGFNILFNGGKLKYPHQIQGLGDGSLARKYNLKYLELPMMLKLRTTDRGGPIFYGQIGLGLGVLLDARGTDVFTYSGGTSEFDKEKISEEIRLFRTALLFGLGVEYPLGPSLKAIGGLALNNGFSDILKGSNLVDSSVSHKAFANFIELNIGLLF